jgi:hypothetical protein
MKVRVLSSVGHLELFASKTVPQEPLPYSKEGLPRAVCHAARHTLRFPHMPYE